MSCMLCELVILLLFQVDDNAQRQVVHHAHGHGSVVEKLGLSSTLEVCILASNGLVYTRAYFQLFSVPCQKRAENVPDSRLGMN